VIVSSYICFKPPALTFLLIVLEIASGTRKSEVDSISLEQYPDVEAALEEINEESELLQEIGACITRLFRVSGLIRQAAPTDRFAKALSKSWLQFIDQFDIAHVSAKFPKLEGSQWLVKRLGRAITRRRQYLSYVQHHRDKLGGTHSAHSGPVVSKPQALSAKQLPIVKPLLLDSASRPSTHNTKASTLAPGRITPQMLTAEQESDPDDDARSYTTVSRSVDGEHESSTLARIPKLADMHMGAKKEIECPFCFRMKRFRNERVWRKHVFSDLRSYVCTFPDCDAQLFGDINEWFWHEMQSHRVSYSCRFCSGKIFKNKDRFLAHVRHKHSELLGDGEEQPLLDISHKPVEQIPAQDCPCCDDWVDRLKFRELSDNSPPSEGAETLIAVPPAVFKRHLAAHLEQLSLFAIPVPTGSAPEDNLDSNVAIEEANSAASKTSEHSRLTFSSTPDSQPARKQHLVSERLNSAHDSFLGFIGSFIGLHLQTRSSKELTLTTQQSVVACRQLLAIAEEIWERDSRRSEQLGKSTEAMYTRLTDLVQATKDIYSSLEAGLDEDMAIPQSGNQLVAAATRCVQSAGECVTEARLVIERVGNFEFENREEESEPPKLLGLTVETEKPLSAPHTARSAEREQVFDNDITIAILLNEAILLDERAFWLIRKTVRKWSLLLQPKIGLTFLFLDPSRYRYILGMHLRIFKHHDDSAQATVDCLVDQAFPDINNIDAERWRRLQERYNVNISFQEGHAAAVITLAARGDTRDIYAAKKELEESNAVFVSSKNPQKDHSSPDALSNNSGKMEIVDPPDTEYKRVPEPFTVYANSICMYNESGRLDHFEGDAICITHERTSEEPCYYGYHTASGKRGSVYKSMVTVPFSAVFKEPCPLLYTCTVCKTPRQNPNGICLLVSCGTEEPASRETTYIPVGTEVWIMQTVSLGPTLFRGRVHDARVLIPGLIEFPSSFIIAKEDLSPRPFLPPSTELSYQTIDPVQLVAIKSNMILGDDPDRFLGLSPGLLLIATHVIDYMNRSYYCGYRMDSAAGIAGYLGKDHHEFKLFEKDHAVPRVTGEPDEGEWDNGKALNVYISQEAFSKLTLGCTRSLVDHLQDKYDCALSFTHKSSEQCYTTIRGIRRFEALDDVRNHASWAIDASFESFWAVVIGECADGISNRTLLPGDYILILNYVSSDHYFGTVDGSSSMVVSVAVDAVRPEGGTATAETIEMKEVSDKYPTLGDVPVLSRSESRLYAIVDLELISEAKRRGLILSKQLDALNVKHDIDADGRVTLSHTNQGGSEYIKLLLEELLATRVKDFDRKQPRLKTVYSGQHTNDSMWEIYNIEVDENGERVRRRIKS
jgi:hypothetical protein